MRTFEARTSRNGLRSADFTRVSARNYIVSLYKGTRRSSTKDERRVTSVAEARRVMREWLAA